MDTLQLIASATGLGVLAGLRLYLTAFCLGLAVRFGWLELSDSFSQLTILGDWRVIGVAGLAVLLEFFADKIPWLDSAWDSLHTLIRPVGAALLSVAAFDSVDPGLRTVLVLLTGGAALTSHSAKAATRVAVNHSPEPFSNAALSLAGDVAVPLSLWVLMEYPLVLGGIAAVFLLVAALIAPRIYRILRVHLLALRACLSVWLGEERKGSSASIGLEHLPAETAAPLPARYARYLNEHFGSEAKFALHGVFRQGPKRLRNRVGYLCVLPDRFVFLIRRPWGITCQEVAYRDVAGLQFEERWMMDGLFLRRDDGELSMDVFKEASAGGQRLAAAWQCSRASA